MRESLVLLFVLLLLFIPSVVCRDHPMPWAGKRVWRRQGYVRAVPRCVHKSLEEAGVGTRGTAAAGSTSRADGVVN